MITMKVVNVMKSINTEGGEDREYTAQLSKSPQVLKVLSRYWQTGVVCIGRDVRNIRKTYQARKTTGKYRAWKRTYCKNSKSSVGCGVKMPEKTRKEGLDLIVEGLESHTKVSETLLHGHCAWG